MIEAFEVQVNQRWERVACAPLTVLTGQAGCGRTRTLLGIYAACAGLSAREQAREVQVLGGGSKPTVRVIPAGKQDRAFLPEEEVLSHQRGFRSSYQRRELPFPRTWVDLMDRATGAPLRVRRDLADLERAIGGSVEVVADDVAVVWHGSRAPMAACPERVRRLVALWLIQRVLEPGAVLCWDCPEAGLDPAGQAVVAREILALVRDGRQVVLATRSLFLLRELYLDAAGIAASCINWERAGSGWALRQGETMDDVGALAVLEVELVQGRRYMAFDQRAGDAR